VAADLHRHFHGTYYLYYAGVTKVSYPYSWYQRIGVATPLSTPSVTAVPGVPEKEPGALGVTALGNGRHAKAAVLR
jgi:hypothetical protein